MSIVFENATLTDAEGLIKYLKQVGKETNNLTFGAEGINISIKQEEEFLAKFKDSHDNIMLLAKENKKIIGIASLSRLSRRMSHRGEFGISVLKDYWNRGIGGQLLSKIIEFAKENSFEIIDLQVKSDNLNAIHLYEKFGFTKLYTYNGFHKIDDENIDFDIMCLRLK